MNHSQSERQVAPQGIVRVKANDLPAGRGIARMEFTLAAAAIGAAGITWSADSANLNGIAILICGVFWTLLWAFSGRDVILNGSRLTKFVCFFGVSFWFWLEAIRLALDEPPFVLVTIYQSLSGEVPPDIVGEGIFSVSLFGLGLVAGYYAVNPSGFVRRMFHYRVDRVSGAWLDVILFSLSLLGWIPMLVAVGGDINWLMEILGEMRAYQVTGYEQDPGLATHFGLLSVAGGALGFARLVAGWRGSRLLQALAFLAASMWVFSTGSRFNLAYLILPALFAIAASIQQARAREVFILRLKIILLAAIIAAGLLLQGALRQFGITEGRSFVDEESAVSIASRGGFGHEHFSALLIAIDFTRQRGEYFLEPMTPFFLVHFIPRAIWPEKPVPISWLEYNDAVTGGSDAFNVTPSVIGQYYMNWGLLGVAFIGLFFGVFARVLDTADAVLRRETQFLGLVVCGMWTVFLFLSFRFYHPLYVTFPVAATAIYVLLSRRQTPSGP